MDNCKCIVQPHRFVNLMKHEQREQRKELASLIDKYGDSWEPWKNELAKFKNNGKDLKGQ